MSEKAVLDLLYDRGPKRTVEKAELNVPPLVVSKGTVQAMIDMYSVYSEVANVRKGREKEYYALMLYYPEGEIIKGTNERTKVVKGVYFPKQFQNTRTYTMVNEELGHVSEMLTDIRDNMEGNPDVAGWTHCHPFESGRSNPSSTDRNNNRQVLVEIMHEHFLRGYNTDTQTLENVSTDADRANNQLVVTNGTALGQYRLSLNGLSRSARRELLDKGIEQIVFEKPVTLGYAYSMIVNGKSTKPKHIFTEAVSVAIDDEGNAQAISNPFPVDLKIVEIENDVAYSRAELEQIVVERFGISEERLYEWDSTLKRKTALVVYTPEMERWNQMLAQNNPLYDFEAYSAPFAAEREKNEQLKRDKEAGIKHYRIYDPRRWWQGFKGLFRRDKSAPQPSVESQVTLIKDTVQTPPPIEHVKEVTEVEKSEQKTTSVGSSLGDIFK